MSAHTPFELSVEAWKLSHTLDPIEAMNRVGVGLTDLKGSAIYEIRNYPDQYPMAIPTYRDYREQVKHRGLGLSKLSFAASLIDPFGTDIVCLDTHMLQLYGSDERAYKSKARYEATESIVLAEAASIDMAPFTYQWAVWDFQRGKQENHSFLWGHA